MHLPGLPGPNPHETLATPIKGELRQLCGTRLDRLVNYPLNPNYNPHRLADRYEVACAFDRDALVISKFRFSALWLKSKLLSVLFSLMPDLKPD